MMILNKFSEYVKCKHIIPSLSLYSVSRIWASQYINFSRVVRFQARADFQYCPNSLLNNTPIKRGQKRLENNHLAFQNQISIYVCISTLQFIFKVIILVLINKIICYISKIFFLVASGNTTKWHSSIVTNSLKYYPR